MRKNFQKEMVWSGILELMLTSDPFHAPSVGELIIISLFFKYILGSLFRSFKNRKSYKWRCFLQNKGPVLCLFASIWIIKVWKFKGKFRSKNNSGLDFCELTTWGCTCFVISVKKNTSVPYAQPNLVGKSLSDVISGLFIETTH